jgi:hypothetical protein
MPEFRLIVFADVGKSNQGQIRVFAVSQAKLLNPTTLHERQSNLNVLTCILHEAEEADRIDFICGNTYGIFKR